MSQFHLFKQLDCRSKKGIFFPLLNMPTAHNCSPHPSSHFLVKGQKQKRVCEGGDDALGAWAEEGIFPWETIVSIIKQGLLFGKPINLKIGIRVKIIGFHLVH